MLKCLGKNWCLWVGGFRQPCKACDRLVARFLDYIGWMNGMNSILSSSTLRFKWGDASFWRILVLGLMRQPPSAKCKRSRSQWWPHQKPWKSKWSQLLFSKVVSEKPHGNWMLRRVTFRVRVSRIKLNGTAVVELNSTLLCVALTPGWFAESIGCCPEWPQGRWLGDSLGCQSTWANLLWRRWWRWSAKKTGYGGGKIQFEIHSQCSRWW